MHSALLFYEDKTRRLSLSFFSIENTYSFSPTSEMACGMGTGIFAASKFFLMTALKAL